MLLFQLRKRSIPLLLVSVALLIGSSCKPSYYTPNEAYMLAVSNKGDLKLAGSYLGGKSSGFFQGQRKSTQYNLQMAYSPIKSVVVVGSHFQLKGETPDSYNNWSAQNSEVALGFYKKYRMDRESDNSYFLHDFYTGTGWGNTFEQFETAGEALLNYQRYFVHTGIHFGWKNVLSFGVGVRYARLKFKEAKLYGPIPEFYEEGISEIQFRNPRNILESSFQMQGGTNEIKVFISGTGILGNSNNNVSLGTPSANIGLIFDLDEIWKKIF